MSIGTERNRRILIVDDTEAIHLDFRKILNGGRLAGGECQDAAAALFGDTIEKSDEVSFEVDSAYQGQEALEMVKQAHVEGRPYSMAFVDMRMPPGWNGLETIRNIWSVDTEIQVVMCTAYSDKTWRDVVSELGISDRFLVLKKPFDAIEVRQMAVALSAKWLLATTDQLTGIPNRRSFEDHSKREWARSTRHEVPLSMAVLDIDYFKRVNDTHGHAAGDEVLVAVANLLRKCCRSGDIVCRHGGEEFFVLLPETKESDALSWGQKIRQSIEQMKFTFNDREVAVTVSIGLAEKITEIPHVEGLVERADQALMAAKNSGRNRVVSSSIKPSEDRLESSTHPLEALTAREIMTSPIHCLSASDSVEKAAEFFLTLRVNSAPIIDDEGRLVGIASEKDLLKVLSQGRTNSAPVCDVMTKNVIHFDGNDSAKDVYDFLARANIRRIVVTENGMPTGVISRGSVLRWFQLLVKGKTGHDFSASLGGIVLNKQERFLQAKQVAKLLSRHAEDLESKLDGDEKNFIPTIIGGASELQELVNDMLAYSQFAEESPAF